MSDMSPLLGAKRKCRQTRLTSAFDPTATLAAKFAVMHKRRLPESDSLRSPGVSAKGETP